MYYRDYDDSDYDSCDESESIVIENGTYEMHVGFAGHDRPNNIFPTVLSTKIIMKKHTHYVGSDGYYKHKDNKYIQHPIKEGIIQNWDQMDKIIEYIFNKELEIKSEDQKIIMIQKPFQSKKNRETLIQLMFEKYCIPCLYTDYTVTAALYAEGRDNGIVLDLGYDTIHSVPIYEGHPLKEASTKIAFGGKNISNYLMELLKNKINSFDGYHKMEIINDIKHKLTFIALDYNEEIKSNKNINTIYQLPDGNKINVGIEKIKCCEILFNPSLIYKKLDYNGIHKLLYHSILKLKTFNADTKYHVSNNIVLNGGCSMFRGIKQRLKKELIEYECLCEEYMINGYLRTSINNTFIYKDVFNLMSRYWRNKLDIKNVISSDYHESKYSSWIGGSIIGSLSSFDEISMYKWQYEEYGPCIAHRLFF